jgi:hypothetical protein
MKCIKKNIEEHNCEITHTCAGTIYEFKVKKYFRKLLKREENFL